MNPPPAGAETVLAAVHLGGKLADGDLVEMRAGHRASLAAHPKAA
jgi:hypothetical protein